MNDLFAELMADPTLAEQIGHLESFPARGARWAETPPVHEALGVRLSALGFKHLYQHQALAAKKPCGGGTCAS